MLKNFIVQNTPSPNSTSKLPTAFRVLSTHTVSLNFITSTSYPLIALLVVRVRSRVGRRSRAPPPRVRWKDGKKVNPAVAAAEDAKAAATAAGAAKA